MIFLACCVSSVALIICPNLTIITWITGGGIFKGADTSLCPPVSLHLAEDKQDNPGKHDSQDSAQENIHIKNLSN
jgi:hypothetical protein